MLARLAIALVAMIAATVPPVLGVSGGGRLGAAQALDVEELTAELCALEEAPAQEPKVFPSNESRDLQIDRGTEKEFQSGLIDFSEVLSAGTASGFTSIEDKSATRRDILDNLSRLDGEDIWIVLAHGREDRVGGILKVDIDRALRADGDPPGIAYLGGCKGSHLLPTFIEASSRVAIGWDRSVRNIPAAEALNKFWKEMFAGKTFGQARAAAHDMYKGALEGSRDLTKAVLDLLTDDAQRRKLQAAVDAMNAELADLPQLVILAKAALGDVSNRTLEAVLPSVESPFGGGCLDGIDNDGDGLIDADDPGCVSVGGTAGLLDGAQAPDSSGGGSGPSLPYAALAGAVAATALAIAAGGRYARRRWLR